ncbi:MAG: prepilin-type N-terminal cleavage/methylation domain-containing protein [Nitrospirae bacterium]|nr:prepilin-type N-terminal cleavage/methylation domain-containing protein [Nitrospirota bacterium]
MSLRGTKCQSNLKKQDSSLMLGMTSFGRRAGFTLLELIIAVTIIGIIVLMVMGAMRLGFRSVSSGEKKMESLERMRASLTIIDSQIQSGIPVTYMENGNLKYYFKGQRGLLQLSTNYSLWDRQRGYVVVTYRVVSDIFGKKSLYASENIIGIKDKREVKLLDGFDEIYFEYFHKDPIDGREAWIEEWRDNLYIPEKVRLHIIDGTKRLSINIPVRARGLGY